jgi:hypothetical protein
LARPRACGVRESWPETSRLDFLGSVEEFKLEARVMCSPGLEVEIELAASLALGSVGDDDFDHVILDNVGNAAPAVKEVP